VAGERRFVDVVAKHPPAAESGQRRRMRVDDRRADTPDYGRDFTITFALPFRVT
jgi:hypothetical protein